MAATEAVRALEVAFERIAQTRMAGLPLNNPALRVQGVGFRSQEDGYLIGVLITPWAVNLVMLAATPSRELHLSADRHRDWNFPSGCYEFMGGEEAECGAYQFCSLFSPAFDFRDHESAVATAQEIMGGLFAEVAADPGAQREVARMSGNSLLEIPTTRRGFLLGVLGSRRA